MNFNLEGYFFMKIFKTIVLLLLLALTVQTGYYALLYKVEITTKEFYLKLFFLCIHNILNFTKLFYLEIKPFFNHYYYS